MKTVKLNNVFGNLKQAEAIQKSLRNACCDCLYYSDSPYLPCAVHPTADYQPWEKHNCPDWELIK